MAHRTATRRKTEEFWRILGAHWMVLGCVRLRAPFLEDLSYLLHCLFWRASEWGYHLSTICHIFSSVCFGVKCMNRTSNALLFFCLDRLPLQISSTVWKERFGGQSCRPTLLVLDSLLSNPANSVWVSDKPNFLISSHPRTRVYSYYFPILSTFSLLNFTRREKKVWKEKKK